MKSLFSWLFNYSNESNDKLFDRLNDLLAEGGQLSDKDRNKLIMELIRRLTVHERDCKRKGTVMLILLFIILGLLLREHLPLIIDWIKAFN